MGQPKAWLPFGPESLLQRVVRRVGTIASPVVVVRAPGQEIPPLAPEVVIISDAVADRGPLQGLAAGLAALPAGLDLAYVTATDEPFISGSWVRRLQERIGEADLAIPRVGGHLQPLSALYRRRTVIPVIESLLAAGRLQVRGLIAEVRTVVLDEDDLRDVDPDLRSAWSLDTPDAYRRALSIAGFGSEGEGGASPSTGGDPSR